MITFPVKIFKSNIKATVLRAFDSFVKSAPSFFVEGNSECQPLIWGIPSSLTSVESSGVNIDQVPPLPPFPEPLNNLQVINRRAMKEVSIRNQPEILEPPQRCTRVIQHTQLHWEKCCKWVVPRWCIQHVWGAGSKSTRQPFDSKGAKVC